MKSDFTLLTVTATHPDSLLGQRASCLLLLCLTGKAAILAAISKTSIPSRIIHGYEHSRMADREDVNLVTDRFVHVAVRFDDDLPEAVGIGRSGVETLGGNNRPRERKVGKPVGIVQDALAPSVGILDAESVFDLRKDIKKQVVRMRRPNDVYTATLLRFAARRFKNSSDSRFTCSCGIPLPSANSRREISTSRESSIWSKRLSIDSASTRYEAARPFCVMSTGRCVSRTRVMYAERLLRHSENGTTSSLGRQRLIGKSFVFNMAISLSVSTPGIVQNSGATVNGGFCDMAQCASCQMRLCLTGKAAILAAIQETSIPSRIVHGYERFRNPSDSRFTCS